MADVGLARDSDAAGLFIARARAVRPDFELTEDNVDHVIAICQRLDGLPLAIELAAAKLNFLPVDAIRERIEMSFDLLTGGPSDVPARMQTMGRGDWLELWAAV